MSTKTSELLWNWAGSTCWSRFATMIWSPKSSWRRQITGQKQNLRSRASYFITSGHAIGYGQRHSRTLSWSWQRISQQDHTPSSVVVCSIRFWPFGTLCSVHNGNVHPTEDSLGQKWTPVGWQNWSRRRPKIIGMGQRTSGVENYATEETLLWKKLQEKRFA